MTKRARLYVRLALFLASAISLVAALFTYGHGPVLGSALVFIACGLFAAMYAMAWVESILRMVGISRWVRARLT